MDPRRKAWWRKTGEKSGARGDFSHFVTNSAPLGGPRADAAGDAPAGVAARPLAMPSGRRAGGRRSWSQMAPNPTNPQRMSQRKRRRKNSNMRVVSAKFPPAATLRSPVRASGNGNANFTSTASSGVYRPAISARNCAAWSAVSTFSATASTVPSSSKTTAARAGP